MAIHMFGKECQILFGEFCGGGVESFAETSSCVLFGCSAGHSSVKEGAAETVGIVLNDCLLSVIRRLRLRNRTLFCEGSMWESKMTM